MEIPVIESGITRFQSPNLLLHLRTLWIWAALIVAAFATFSSLLKRSKRIILRLRKGKTVISHPSPSTYSDDDDDDDDGDVSYSFCSDDEEEEEEEEGSSAGSEKDFEDFEEIQGQGQNGKSDSHLAWPEFARDGSVVKFWDGLGLGFDRSNRSISLLDLNRDEILRYFLWESDEIPAVHVASPETFLSGGARGLKVWDARATGQTPAASAGGTWRSEGLESLVGIGGGNNEVYVGEVGKLTVVDLRNLRSPLAETSWWGDGAVTAGDGAGLVSWCRNAARCLSR